MKANLSKILIKISYMLFALFISAAIWMFVEITQNELLEREILVNMIHLKGEELLNSRGLLVSAVLIDDLTLTFEGTRPEIRRLSEGVVDVEVNLGDVRSVGAIPLDYEIILPDNVNERNIRVKSHSDSQIIISIDRILTREFFLDVSYTGGTSSEEYMPETPEVEPASITITGPEGTVSQIAKVSVPIYAQSLSTTYSDDLEFVLYDENDEELGAPLRESGVLTFSHETVRVTVPIRLIKSLPLHVELSHANTTSNSNTNWYTSPMEVVVSGDPELLRDINSIMLGTIDMRGFGLRDTKDFSIIIPDYLNNLTGVTIATVFVEIVQQSLILDYIPVPNLQVVNTPPGYSASIINQSTVVTLRGTAASLSAVSPENIWIVADLTDANTTGPRRVSARVSIVGTDANVDIIGDYSMVVSIAENTDLP